MSAGRPLTEFEVHMFQRTGTILRNRNAWINLTLRGREIARRGGDILAWADSVDEFEKESLEEIARTRAETYGLPRDVLSTSR